VKEVSVTEDLITFRLMDGRVISVPLAWSWRLSEATPAERERFEIIGDGHGVHCGPAWMKTSAWKECCTECPTGGPRSLEVERLRLFF